MCCSEGELKQTMIAQEGTPGPDFPLPARPDWVFMWTERTMNKLGEGRDKRMRFIFQMIEFFYQLLMDGDAVVSGVPFQQYLGPLGGAV